MLACHGYNLPANFVQCWLACLFALCTLHLQACAYSGRLVLLDKERPGLNTTPPPSPRLARNQLAPALLASSAEHISSSKGASLYTFAHRPKRICPQAHPASYQSKVRCCIAGHFEPRDHVCANPPLSPHPSLPATTHNSHRPGSNCKLLLLRSATHDLLTSTRLLVHLITSQRLLPPLLPSQYLTASNNLTSQTPLPLLLHFLLHHYAYPSRPTSHSETMSLLLP